jgi:hypothetical protein
MVGELTKTRELSVMPRLALDFLRLGPAVVDVLVQNVGTGPALDIDVRLIFEPRPEAQVERGELHWRRSLLAPGDSVDFKPPGDLGFNIQRLPEEYQDIRLKGRMTDATGKGHEVDEVLPDLPERWHLPPEGQRYRKTPERELADAFAHHLGGLRDAIDRLNRRAGG